jgi:hypothetical protein
MFRVPIQPFYPAHKNRKVSKQKTNASKGDVLALMHVPDPPAQPHPQGSLLRRPPFRPLRQVKENQQFFFKKKRKN